VAAGVFLAAAFAGCSTPYVSGGGADGADVNTADEIIVVCDSGTSSSGGIDTSSSVAIRLPAGSPVPDGCHLG
jgi:hypothetical protein